MVFREDLDDVSGFCRLMSGYRSKPVFFGLLIVGSARLFGDDHFHAAVAQILSLGMTLAAIADDRHLLAAQQIEIRIPIIINSHNRLLLVV